MFPEILNIIVPEEIAKTAPNNYINAKSAITKSNEEIERLKNYFNKKTASSTSILEQESGLLAASMEFNECEN